MSIYFCNYGVVVRTRLITNARSPWRLKTSAKTLQHHPHNPNPSTGLSYLIHFVERVDVLRCNTPNTPVDSVWSIYSWNCLMVEPIVLFFMELYHLLVFCVEQLEMTKINKQTSATTWPLHSYATSVTEVITLAWLKVARVSSLPRNGRTFQFNIQLNMRISNLCFIINLIYLL